MYGLGGGQIVGKHVKEDWFGSSRWNLGPRTHAHLLASTDPSCDGCDCIWLAHDYTCIYVRQYMNVGKCRCMLECGLGGEHIKINPLKWFQVEHSTMVTATATVTAMMTATAMMTTAAAEAPVAHGAPGAYAHDDYCYTGMYECSHSHSSGYKQKAQGYTMVKTTAPPPPPLRHT